MLIIGLSISTLYLSHEIDKRKPTPPKHKRTGLEHARNEKHEFQQEHVREEQQTNETVPKVAEVLESTQKRMFVLTTGKRTFLEPSDFVVQKVFGTDHKDVVAQTYDEGYGPKGWPEGAKKVAEGHVTIWKRIASECSDWCFVSEDDAIWPDEPLPDMPEDGLVSYFGESVCTAATRPYSSDYRQVVKSVVRGRCMPYGAVAYALSGSFAKTLLNALPMDKPVDHFLWEQAVKHHMGFVARDFRVKHARGKSLRESVVKPPVPPAGANMCAVILACNRPNALAEALSSWSKQSGLPITISMDCESPESDQVVDDWIQKEPLWTKIDSFQRHKKERSSEERIARHWLSSLARMFRRPECDYVIYAEEDHIVSDDFFDSAKRMVSVFDMCPTCWSMNMGCHRDCWGRRENNPSAVIRMESGNMGVIYTRKGFRMFMDSIDIFCDMRGNWDNNVHSMAALGHIKPHSLTFLHSRIHHLTTCRSSRTGVTHRTHCDWSRETAEFFSKDRRVKGDIIDRGVAPHGRGNRHYARANAFMKQACLTAASGVVPERTSVKHQTSSTLSGNIIRTLKTANVNYAAKTCFENNVCFGFERLTNSLYALKGKGSVLPGVHDVFQMGYESPCTTKISPEINILIPSSGRAVLCETLKSIQCHSSYLTHCPNGANVYIYNGYDCDVSYKCIQKAEHSLEQVRKKGPVHASRQRQTLDFANMLHSVSSGPVILIDDDFVWCDSYVEHLEDAFRRPFNMAFIGQGSNGMLIKNVDDIKRLANYLLDHVAKSHVDVLMYQFAASQKTCIGRAEMRVSRHKGLRSSFENVKYEDDNFCGMPMFSKGSGNVFGVEWGPKTDKRWRMRGCDARQTRHAIAVAVPTYNRVGYVKLCAEALKNTIPPLHVHVFDDHSDQYSIGDLKDWFGTENVRQNSVRKKPDRQARAIVEWFVETDYDWLVTLDSDLIVRPDWLSRFKHHLPKTQGIVSLYHSGNRNHPTGKCEDGLCEMKTLGNAGVSWSKPLAKKMLSAMKNRDGFDWGWTNWLQKQGITQYAFDESLVLHVGMHGTWGADSKREKSKGFDMSTLVRTIKLKAEKYLYGALPA